MIANYGNIVLQEKNNEMRGCEMKKNFAFRLAAIAIISFLQTPVFAADSVKYVENDPSINIYPPGIVVDGNDSTVQMLSVEDEQWITTESIAKGSPIRLLMINGGFVPAPEIVVENSRTLVPVRIISEILGATVDWDDSSRTVTITDGKNKIILVIGSANATVDNVNSTLDAPAKIISDRTYVPLRFIAEALKAEVGYTDQFNDWPTSIYGNTPLSVVTIERSNAKPTYSVNDGLEAIKKESEKTYQLVVNYLKETDRTFSEADKDYDPQKISYINKNLGRYYLYRLEGFENYRILFNPYTGDISAEQPGTVLLNINKGFIRIPWLYQ
jgi:hypothetical protein